MHIREPGGIKISEKIRNILLDVRNKEMTKECEVLLYMAARAQLVEEIIAPALKKGLLLFATDFWIQRLLIRDTDVVLMLSSLNE